MFAFGVASGDVSDASVTIWTRVSRPGLVGWRVEARHDSAPVASGATNSDEAGFVHITLDGLEPGTQYSYSFSCRGATSEVGRFKTMPKDGPIRFAVVTCAKFNSGYFNAYGALAGRDDIDFVLHLGDYIYEAGQAPRGHQTPGADIGRPFDPLHDCVAAEDYRRRYAQYRSDPDLRAMHLSHAVIATIDDHEIADNAWAGGSEVHFESDGPWQQRLGNALSAWEQWQPTRRRPTRGDPIWGSHELGANGCLFLCDSRLARTDPYGEDGPSKTILGEAQLRALCECAETDQRPWLVVAMPSKLLPLDAAREDPMARFALEKLKLAAEDGRPFHDRWDSYGRERDELIGTLLNNRRRVLMLCGDVHFSAFSRMRLGSSELLECVATSVTSPNLDDKMGWQKGTRSLAYQEQMVDSIEELVWCDLDDHGFMIVELDQGESTCEWWGVSTVLEPDPSAEMSHGERFTA